MSGRRGRRRALSLAEHSVFSSSCSIYHNHARAGAAAFRIRVRGDASVADESLVCMGIADV